LLLEASRYPDPSYHIWIFFLVPFSAKAARWLGIRILDLANLNPKLIEVFPKQGELTEDRPFGNFVKLPLGFHRVNKKWSRFLDPETWEPLKPDILTEVSGISFSGVDTQKMLGLASEKKPVQIKFELPKKFKQLKDEQVERDARAIAKYWIEGFRNDLELATLGFYIKHGVSYESARRVIKRVCELTNTSPADTAVALEKVRYHYDHRIKLGSGLKGISGIRQAIAELKKRGLVE